MPKKLHIPAIAAVFLMISSCNYYKHVPEGNAILWEDDIEVQGLRGAPAEAYSILKQRPAYRFFWIFAPGLAIYSWGDGTDSSFFSRIGQKPIIFDSVKAARGAEQLQDYYFNSGHFKASSTFEVKNGKKAKVTYYIDPGPQYYIRNLEYEFPNEDMLELFQAHSGEKVVDEGDEYDTKTLNRERERLTAIFRNNGYYNFSRNFISFDADTFLTGDTVDLRMLINQRPFTQNDSVYYKPHKRYRLNKIFIEPDHDYSRLDEPSDSFAFRGYNLIFDRLEYMPRYFTDAVHMRPFELYDQQKVKDTYAHLLSYNAFQNIDITFEEFEVDTLGPLLDVYIRAAPMKKRSWTIESEVTTTSGKFGINLSTGWLNRNIFHSGEELQIRLNTGIDYQSALSQSQLSRTFEIGGEVGIQFPRFLLPFNTIGLVPKRMRPTSRISLYASRFYRSEFDRETFGGRLIYNWKETERKSWQVDLLDLSYTQLYSISRSFRQRLNDIQEIAFQPALISATKVIFTYNQQVASERRSYHFFKTSGEVAGTMFSLLNSTNALGDELNDEGQVTVGGVPYFQYIKADIDYRFYWNMARSLTWVNRIYLATIRPYGNSFTRDDNGNEVRNAPFSKFLFIGGSNDLRAWPAYRLGAGTQQNTNYFPLQVDSETNELVYDKDAAHDTSFALGTIKFLFNSEYRFPIFSYFKGALFLDAGNIWLNGGLENQQTDFRLKHMFRQLAIGGGIGLRMDFDFFLVRFDVAAKIRDPGRLSLPEPDPWVIDNHPLRNLTYNIALGYPF